MRAAFLIVLVAAGACGDAPQSPEVAEADRLWRVLESDPSTPNFEAFQAANLAAARHHGELNDRVGVQFQVRAYEAQAGEAKRTREPLEASKLAFEVMDGIDDLERRGLISVYDELLPGAAKRLAAARARAAGVAR